MSWKKRIMEIPFFNRVYQLVGEIPPGKVATYGLLAFLAGKPKTARLVGQAVGRAPEGVPCHRVVRKDGSLPPGDVFGAPDLQHTLLTGEGVGFLPDGRVDMAAHLWIP